MPLTECPTCRGFFKIEQFFKDDQKSGRRRDICRSCFDAARRRQRSEYREANRDKILARARGYRKEYYRTHKDEILEKRKTDSKFIAYQRAYQKEYRARKKAEKNIVKS